MVLLGGVFCGLWPGLGAGVAFGEQGASNGEGDEAARGEDAPGPESGRIPQESRRGELEDDADVAERFAPRGGVQGWYPVPDLHWAVAPPQMGRLSV